MGHEFETGWVALSVGENHSCGVTADGELFCWGASDRGQVGILESSGEEVIPVRVGDSVDWMSVSAGQSHTCGLKGEGALYCWGNGSNGRLGFDGVDEQLVPALSGDPMRFMVVVAQWNHTMALRTDGAVFVFGTGSYGRLGLGDTDDRREPTRLCLTP